MWPNPEVMEAGMMEAKEPQEVDVVEPHEGAGEVKD